MNMIEPDVNAKNWQISTLERLAAIAQELTACLDSNRVWQILHQHIHALLDPLALSIHLQDDDGQTVRCTHFSGQQYEPPSLPLSTPDSLIARCLREGQAIPSGTADKEGLDTLYLPMQSSGRVIGVMVFRAQKTRMFGEREQFICRSLCAWGTIAMVNAAAYKKRAQAAPMPGKQSVHEESRQHSAMNSAFLANMSHEIRNPMNAIIGMAHLTLGTELTLRQQDYIKKIHRAGLSLLGLINDILDFSKIEAGKLEMDAVPFLLDDVLNHVASVTSQRAAEKQLEYGFDIAPDVPEHCIGDPLRLSQVLINLVNHAIKSSEQGEIGLRIRRLPPANPANLPEMGRNGSPIAATQQSVRLDIAVSDSSGDISPAHLETLFQPFAQSQGSAQHKYGGSGLGLVISRQLVHMMGSQLAVRSEANRGASFYFELELGLAATCHLPAPLPEALTASRILLVDDHPHTLQTLASMLQTRSLRVDTAPSGIAALRAMIAADQAHDPYTLVLTDWHMPKMTGLELRKRLAERPAMVEGSQPAMPQVVLLGGPGAEAELPDLEQAGFAALWSKPMSPSGLLNKLCTLFADKPDSAPDDMTPATSFAGASVLLAEDNDINQQIAVELLSIVGIRVDVANTGIEAVEKLLAAGEHGYSAILMDLEMPEMNGHQATLRIRSEKRFDDLPIIAMTAHAMAEVREQCAREGMQDYLTKPIHPEHLFKTLARWIKPH